MPITGGDSIMAHYLVRAKAVDDKLDELRRRLDSGEIRELQPFHETYPFVPRRGQSAFASCFGDP